MTNGLHDLARKYPGIFVRGRYLFREANSFPGAWLEENCELRAFALIVNDINLVSSSTQAQVFLSHLARNTPIRCPFWAYTVMADLNLT